ncbi:MAG: Rieske (2Fe-2S) domain protein [Acidimicrobiales bacterium]|nr:Rieske (2Fe-2S) domain protein [Acidimicrobiales bacterium]
MADLIPKERYTGREFAQLEMERLWPNVWQIACREEEVPRPGDYVEYVIGDQSILVMRAADGSLGAYYNACLHRGTRLAAGVGTFDEGRIKCRYHGWCYDLSGCVTNVPDREEFTDLPADLRLGALRAETWGGFVFVNMDPSAEPLLEFLDPIPELLGPYRLDEMRFRSYQTLVLPANWKAVLDAFNEGYHVQGAHPQILPWTDDVSIAYEQYDRHARYGRLENARRELRPSPRLSLDDSAVDEGEILASLVAGLGGAFLKDERAIVEELRASQLPPGSLLGAYQDRRMRLLAGRGFDVTDFTPDRMTSAEDVYWFPNMVGPIYPGSAILFRVRPNGLDPDSSLKDIWVLEWRPPGEERPMPERRFYPDWTAKDWGEISNQDYANLVEVQAGMHSRGFEGLRLNPRQEGNIAHMHRVLDRYLS